MNLPVGESEYENYTDENIELLKRVYKKIQKYIKVDKKKNIWNAYYSHY